jgi:hypothetical protein
MSLLSQDVEKEKSNNSKSIPTEPESDSEKKNFNDVFTKKVKSIETTVGNFFGNTLGFNNRIKKFEAYLNKEMKPSNIREYKHRFLLTPFNFSSNSMFTIPEQQEASNNSFYSSYRSLQSQQNYHSYSRPQNGSSETNYNQLEYRLYDRLRLFYIHRTTHDAWFANASSFTIFDYKDKLIGQFKKYSVNESQERIGLSYYHPISSFLNLGVMFSRYSIHQKFDANSTTILVNNTTGFGYETSQTSMKANVPGLGFEFYPVRTFTKLFNLELKEDISFLNFIQIVYSRESLQTDHRKGYPELSTASNVISDSKTVITPINISPIYTYNSFQYNGNIENIAFAWRFLNFVGIRYGYANELYQKKYDYYLRIPFVEGLNNPLNLNPLSSQEILLQSIYFSNLAKTKSYYKESYFRIEFNLNYDNFLGTKSANEN